ncbi:Uncharacterised protein [Mycobacteroides abscessus subsp. abscessus]|nr:Uncharacterised protein [Mycobacteroides abscessus subsp. abscessus]
MWPCETASCAWSLCMTSAYSAASATRPSSPPSDADHRASSVICSSTDHADWMSLPATSEKVRM